MNTDSPVIEIQTPALEAPKAEHNAADLLFWPYAWSTDNRDGEVDFVYNAYRRADNDQFKSPQLLHKHSTEAWKQKLNSGL